MKKFVFAILATVFSLCPWNTHAATLIVTTNSDDGSSGTLRSLMASAQAGDTIVFDANLSGSNIVLSNRGLTLNQNMTIDASALPKGIRIDGNHQFTVFTMNYGMTATLKATLKALTITNGGNNFYGGAVDNNGGELTLIACTLTGNSAGLGGGICNYYGTMIVDSCTLAGNSASNYGGGIFNQAILTLNACTLVKNSAGAGGGICNGGTLLLTNNIIAENSAGNVLTGNDIYDVSFFLGTFALTYGGSNLVQSTAGNNTNNGTVIGAPSTTNAPDLAPLGNYGGPTPTMLPLPGSPAIDAGSDAANLFTNDQRGLPRLSGAHVDLGAAESQQSPAIQTLPASSVVMPNAVLNGLIVPVDLTNQTVYTWYFAYGTTTNYGNYSPTNSGTISIATKVSQSVGGLLPSAIYHYQFFALTNAGNLLTGDDAMLATLTLEASSDVVQYGQPITLTATLSSAIPDGETIIFSNEMNSLGTATLINGSATLTTGNLPLGTNVLTASYTGDHTYTGSLSPTVTVVVTPSAPAVATLAATVTGATSTILNGTVNPDGAETTYYFAYGLTTNYGNLTVLAGLATGSTNVNISMSLTNLLAGTTYYAALIASNSVGMVSGTPVSFMTGNYKVVTNTNDDGAGSLRAVLAAADAGDTVIFTNTLSGQTIWLTSAGLEIDANVTIDASALTGGICVDGSGQYTVLTVASNATAVFNALTITNGYNTYGGGIYNLGALTLNASILVGNSVYYYGGGGIYNGGTLTLNASTVAKNWSADYGGGIHNDGILILNASTLANNSADAFGGGIENFGTLTINASILVSNSTGSDGGGGGIANLGTLILNASTVAENSAGFNGGGIENFSTAILNNSTLADNSSGNEGGGIGNGGTLILNACTVAGNSASVQGGGIENEGTLQLTNSIIAENSAGNGNDIYIAPSKSITYGGSNLVQSIANSGTANGFPSSTNAPDLAPLGNYGGPTPTMLPLPGSPAIDAGSDAANLFTNDQRGLPRLSGAHVDLGAVEAQPDMIATLAASNIMTTSAILDGLIVPAGLTNQAIYTWYFAYGTTTNYANYSLTNNELVTVATNVDQLVSGLLPGTAYHYQFFAQTNGGSQMVGGDAIFITPQVLTMLTLEASSDTVQYGQPITLTATLSSAVPDGETIIFSNEMNSLGTTALTNGIAILTTDSLPLGCNTLTASYAGDHTYTGSLSPTVTVVVTPSAPAVAILAATVTGATSAILNGTVNPDGAETTYYFAYGLTTNYGNLTVLADLATGSTNVPVNMVLTNLMAGTTYYAVLIASNSVGMISGTPVSFMTGNYKVVTNTNDDGTGSLRAVLAAADAGDTVIFTNTLSGQTIWLTSAGLEIGANVTIDASALTGGIQINGNHQYTVLTVNESAIAIFNALTITNGYSDSNYSYGGIFNAGTLMMTACTVSGNVTGDSVFGGDSGGGIFNSGTLTMTACTLSGNSAGTLNSVSGGGGIFNYYGNMTLTACTLTGNAAGTGGGIANLNGSVTLTACTLSENFETSVFGAGGGIFNSTFITTDNNATGTVTVINSIVAGNPGGDIYNDSYSTLTYGGTNLVQSIFGIINNDSAVIIAAPNLAPLGNYGGPTQTMPPLAGSPAIDAGSDADNTSVTDQRGLSRLSGTHVDIGAVEAQFANQSPALVNGTLSSTNGGFQFSFVNTANKDFTVYASPDITLPFCQWQELGRALETPAGSGQYIFIDPQSVTNAQLFYRVTSP